MAVSELQERFCQEYLVDCNISAAALRAGCTDGRQGYTMMEIPAVKERIEILRAEREERTRIKADWVIEQLREVVNRCMQLEPITEKGQLVLECDPFGEVRALCKFDPRGATAALQLLGKHVGMFTDKVEHSGTIDTKSMSNNEFARRIAHVLHEAVERKKGEQSSHTVQ